MARNEYLLDITLNGRNFNSVIIDQHYLKKHPEMSDELILELVGTLHGRSFPIEMRKNTYEYFTVEPVDYEDKPYRLVLVMCLGDDYLGVINAFRVSRR